MFWKLTLTQQYTWLNGPDLTNQVLPWYQFEAGEWRQGHFPLWDPYHWGGQSLIGQGQPGVAYPLNWILFAWPLRHGWMRLPVLNWYFVLIHCLGAWFCYWFARDLGRTRAASILAGLIFATAGYLGSIDWPQMLNGAIWTPLVFMFFIRVHRGVRPLASSALSGACLGMAFLSGHHQVPIFLSIVMMGLWLWWLSRNIRDGLRAVLLPCVFGLFIFGVSALQTLPGYEYWNHSLRWVGAKEPVGWNDKVPYSVHAEHSFAPEALIGMVVPGFRGELNPFLGFVALALAGIGIYSSWRSDAVRILTAIGVAGFGLALGQFNVLHGMLYSILPAVEKARSPSMALVILDASVAVLAAFGLDACRQRIPRVAVTALLAIGGFLYAVLLAVAMIQGDDLRRFTSFSLAALVALLLGLLFFTWRRGHISARSAEIAVILLAMFEIGNTVGVVWPNRDRGWPMLEKMAQNADVIQYLSSQIGPVRVDVDSSLIPFNFGDWVGIDQFRGYTGVTANVVQHHGEAGVRSILGVNYYLGNKPRFAGQQLAFQGANGTNVYLESEAMPPAWVVHRAIVVGPAQITEQLNRPTWQLRQEAFIVGKVPSLEACSGQDTASILKRVADRITLEANLHCQGLMIVGQTYFPGWKATIDGKSASILETDSMLDGIVVPKGYHKIEMRYRPWLVYVGAFLTALSLGIAIALAAAPPSALSSRQSLPSQPLPGTHPTTWESSPRSEAPAPAAY